MNPNPFLVSNHFTVPEVTEKKRNPLTLLVLMAAVMRLWEATLKADDTIERNMVGMLCKVKLLVYLFEVVQK